MLTPAGNPRTTPLNRPARTANSLSQGWPSARDAAAAGNVSVDTIVPGPGEAPDSLLTRLAGVLRRHEGGVLMVMAYGSTAMCDAVIGGLEREVGVSDWPLLWVEGAACFGGGLAGFQIFVLHGGSVERIRAGGKTIGSVYHDGDARHCLLAGLTPRDPARPRAEQCEEFFETAGSVLAAAGFAFGDIVRTWFYNDEILAWYDDFNRVRTAYYAKQTFSSGSLPASTAVRGRNPAGAALTFGAWAVVPAGGRAEVTEVASPLQCPAPAYGSSFSRATEIASGGWRRLLVSGTASIEPGGRTIWQGDIEKQVALTMQVVEAILKPRGMGFRDVTRATAYFKRADDAAVLQRWLSERNLQAMPVVPVHCDICRDDLLFEIELDACVMG